ncbi:hypothetical protein [Phytohabitans suffuscus]|uniref:Uncharacterized protein n=1 Tax=Phytohabitans suffuscus TaxID=624315 RepID=A0A6F8YEB1_9ACTN|nr:hypothetical protein [Phytohabitans suffuscus]BCB84446.1 hypothetical protein Psuf_017590 [Phytohabitans suffuscus]
MTLTTPYVQDLRSTAVAIAAQHIAASWPGRSEAAQFAAIGAALDAAAPFLLDAFLIEEAVAVVEGRTLPTPRVTAEVAHEALILANGNRHRYLQGLQREGWLSLRTLDLEELEDEDSEAPEV